MTPCLLFSLIALLPLVCALDCFVGFAFNNDELAAPVQCRGIVRQKCVRVEGFIVSDHREVIVGTCSSAFSCKYLDCRSTIETVLRSQNQSINFDDVGISCCGYNDCNFDSILLIRQIQVTRREENSVASPNVSVARTKNPNSDKSSCNGKEIIIARKIPENLFTPKYPMKYNDNLNCAWKISADSPGSQVEVYFTQIHTEACCDVLKIRDGSSRDGSVIKEFRGTTKTRYKFTSTFGSLFITFTSDDSIAREGFQLTYYAVNVSTATNENSQAIAKPKRFHSPNWPLPYANNLFCIWTLRTFKRRQIGLRVISLLTESCCDNILIRDGLKETSSILAYRSGRSKRVAYYQSSGNIMQVRFRSDESATFKGFMARYKSVRRIDVPPATARPSTTNCGKKLAASLMQLKVLSTPSFPQYYGDNLKCVWLISSLPKQRVRIWFSYISTQSCCDWIKVRNGRRENSPKLGTLSGVSNSFHSFITTGRYLRVEFDTNEAVAARGFKAFYEVYDRRADRKTSTCGGYLTARGQVRYFSTSNWPNAYNSNSTCLWRVTAALPSKGVAITLLGIITQKSRDFIKVFDGPTVFSKTFGTFSGVYLTRFLFVSTGRHATIFFQSDSTVNHGGFRASYAQVDRRLQLPNNKN